MQIQIKINTVYTAPLKLNLGCNRSKKRVHLASYDYVRKLQKCMSTTTAVKCWRRWVGTRRFLIKKINLCVFVCRLRVSPSTSSTHNKINPTCIWSSTETGSPPWATFILVAFAAGVIAAGRAGRRDYTRCSDQRAESRKPNRITALLLF